MSMLREVFTYAEERNSKAEPRHLKAEEHYQDYIKDLNARAQIIPFKMILRFNAEEVLDVLHGLALLSWDTCIITQGEGLVNPFCHSVRKKFLSTLRNNLLILW